MFDPATTTLDDLLEHAWVHLETGVRQSQHGFHWPVVSSVRMDGTPDARVVVLRGCDRGAAELRFYTDRRSPKVAQLTARPGVALTFHHGESGVQVRALAAAEIATTGGVADAEWSRAMLSSRRCYLAPAAPSSPSAVVSPNLPHHLRGALPEPDEVERGRPNFAVVVCRVTRLDVLCLQREGHVRAAFELRDGVACSATWLEP